MTDAPKRIWIYRELRRDGFGEWYNTNMAKAGVPNIFGPYIHIDSAAPQNCIESLQNCLLAFEEQPTFKKAGACVLPESFVRQLLAHFQSLREPT